MKVWRSLDEETVEKDETTHEFHIDCNLECEATKQLLTPV